MNRARGVAAQAAMTVAVIALTPVVAIAGMSTAVILAWQQRKDRR